MNKRTIILALALAGTVATAQVRTATEGFVTNRIAKAAAAGTNYTDAATAGLPTYAAVTGIVAAAVGSLTIDDAKRLVQADSNAWITVEGGTGWLYRISARVTNEWYDTELAQFNDPSKEPPADGTKFYFASSLVFTGSWGAIHFDSPVVGINQAIRLQEAEIWENPPMFPLEFESGGAIPPMNPSFFHIVKHSVTTVTTNRFAIETVEGTSAAILAHNTNDTAHPDIWQAIENLPRLPPNATRGWLMFDAGLDKWLQVAPTNGAFIVYEVDL